MHPDKYRQRTKALISQIILLSCLLSFTIKVYATEKIWSFNLAVLTAQKNDPWLSGNKHQQQAIESMSQAVATLPDPRVSIGLANLPTNGFDFSQEAMTQLKVGITQMFPRGDTLALKNQQLRIKSEAYPFLRADRTAKVAVTVGSLWLDAYRVQQSITLIKSNRALFEQLADVAQASYSSALGKTRQQDIIRAQLELTHIDDRLNRLAQQQSAFLGRLSPWLTTAFTTDGKATTLQETIRVIEQLYTMQLAQQLPDIDLLKAPLVMHQSALTVEKLATLFAEHPAILALDKKISATKTGINLAEQQYQPQWGVNASYGYRDDDPMGNSRADFFSVGISFDLPIFTGTKQDMSVKSAISQTEAVKTERILLLRQLLAAFSSAKGRLVQLHKRQALYQQKLLPQTHDQAEASLTAYTNDDGNFAEVVRACIALLNAEIEQLNIAVAEQKIILELNYLFVGNLVTSYAPVNAQQSYSALEEKL